MKQMKLNIYQGKRGGRRPGSGRKRIHSKGVAHRQRDKVGSRNPMHINFKYRTQIKTKFCLRLLKKAILNARTHGLRVNHFSLQSNHIHLIVEAESNETLTKGMRSLTVTFAKGLKMGKVQIERYHLHVLKAVREIRNAVQYVLFNKQKHEKGNFSTIDGFSSLLSLDNAMRLIQNFAGKEKITIKIGMSERFTLDESRSWLLRRGETELTELPRLSSLMQRQS